MKKGYFVLMGLMLVAFVSPQQSEAFVTKAQSAELLKDGKGIIYSVTYDFGMEKYDLYMPIIPERKEASSTAQARTMTYAIMEDGTETAFGESLGIVVSNAEIRDGQYFIPKGTGKRLTLITLLKLPQTLVYEPHNLALQVTNLPFTMKYVGGEAPNQLNPFELDDYLTPEVKI